MCCDFLGLASSPGLSSGIFSSHCQLGGVQLDKDLRVLTGYLSSHTSWPVRDKFARLMQISTLLTLETVRLCPVGQH